MSSKGFKLASVVGLIAALTMWIAPQASADITGSHIDTPPSGTFGIATHTLPLNTATVSGTTTGGTPGTDQVDIVCTNADGSDPHVEETNVGTALDGSFTSDVPLASLNYRPCIQRAYPSGVIPANISSFTGPLTMYGDLIDYALSTGPNQNDRYDYYVWAQQHTGAFDYYSVSSCGLCDGYLFNSNLEQTATTFWTNDYLSKDDGVSPTRSQIQVDGTDAYAVLDASVINNQAASGYPQLSSDVDQDPSTGDTTITESDPIVKCGEDTSYPPNSTKCATFVTTGVTLNRTIVQDHDGHLATVTDDWVSTDASTHSLNLLPQNDQHFDSVTGNAAGVAYQFPGETSYSTHVIGDVVNFGSGAPGAVFIKQQGSPDDATGDGQGAIVFGQAANPAKFIDSISNNSSFDFHQTGTVPTSGTLTFRMAYAQAYTCAEVASLAQTAASSFGGSVASPCPSTPGGPTTSNHATGQRAAALKKCKRKHKAKARKKCRKRAKKLPA